MKQLNTVVVSSNLARGMKICYDVPYLPYDCLASILRRPTNSLRLEKKHN